MRTRADRRNSYAKRKKKALIIVKRWEGWAIDLGFGYGLNLATPQRIGRMAGTRKCCSCYCCGNPRRHTGERTIQERRAFQGVG